jgi:Txe/YoeB family toxin of Txe-Axe toxin-antitoxin module
MTWISDGCGGLANIPERPDSGSGGNEKTIQALFEKLDNEWNCTQEKQQLTKHESSKFSRRFHGDNHRFVKLTSDRISIDEALLVDFRPINR